MPRGTVRNRIQCEWTFSLLAFSVWRMFRFHLKDVFARNTGYNEVGELNNIIIIYPQAVPTNTTNPFGCWDWWGYTVSFYGTKKCTACIASRSQRVSLIVIPLCFSVCLDVCRSFRDLQPTTIDRSQPNLVGRCARGKNMQNFAYFQRQPFNAYSCH